MKISSMIMTGTESNGNILHDGIVRRSDNDSVTVMITARSACSGCHAEGSCNLSGKEDKLIDIKGYYNVAPGDLVTVIMKKSMGFAALGFGYILPLIVLLSSLILLIALSVTELTAALVSLALLFPYFLLVYLFRKKIDKKFTFSIKTDK